MITKSKSLKLADAVLSLIDTLLPESSNILCEPYMNGREEGWALYKGVDQKIVFAQFRRTDDIVVYVGENHQFSMQGNSPKDEVYNRAYFFDVSRIHDCAEWIKKFLITEP